MYRYLYILTILLLGLFISIIFENPVFVFFLLILGSFTTLLLKNANKIFRHLIIINIIGITFLLMLHFGLLQKYGVPYIGGGSDDLMFEHAAKYYLSTSNGDIFLPHQMKINLPNISNSIGFVWLLEILIEVANLIYEYHSMVFPICNIFFLMWIGILMYKYFEKSNEFTEKENIVLLYIISLFPNALYISGFIFRDTLIALMLTSIFYLWSNIKLYKHKDIVQTLINTFILSYFCYWLRNISIIYVFVIVAFVIFCKIKKKSSKFALGILFFALFLFIIANGNYGNYFVGYVQTYSEYRENLTEGLSSFIFALPIFPFGLLFRVMFGLISPFVIPVIFSLNKLLIDIDITINFLIFLGVLLQIYCLPFLFKSFKFKTDEISYIYIALFLSVIVTTFTFRHFVMLYPFMFPLMMRGYVNTSNTTSKLYFFLITVILVILMIVYMILKY